MLVSREQATVLHEGWRKAMPVLVRINGQPKAWWHINMVPVGDGSFYLYLHGDVRKASTTQVGDRVARWEVQFDITYRSGPMALPNWFQTILDERAEVKHNWDLLTPSRQKEIVRYLSNLKSQDAIDRNLLKVVRVLSGKPDTFLGRSWNSENN